MQCFCCISEIKTNWIDFKNKMFDLVCFSIHQVYARQPGFDRNNLVHWVSKGYLVHLRRGWYAFSEYGDKPDIPEYIADRIYRPSYISLHTALSFYGWVPESVVQITSVTSLKTARFKNEFGEYSYKSVKSDLMFGYTQRLLEDGRAILHATPQKALFDLNLAELKAAVTELLQSVDLREKQKDFEHLLFNRDNSLRILNFLLFIQAL